MRFELLIYVFDESLEECVMEMEDIMHTPKNMVKVTFDYNYAGAPKDIVIEVEKGRSIPVFDDKTENTDAVIFGRRGICLFRVFRPRNRKGS